MFSIILLTSLTLCFVFTIGVPVQKESTCGFQSCNPVDPNKINVHLIPHSHDDVGWLKTVDQYYYGSQTYYQKAGVQYIIGSVIQSLRDFPERRFIQVETAFFWKWWQKQNDHIKDVVRQLVNEGRFEIINGAWSMNDEAAAHYHSIIDQFTWGLKTINETLGDCGRPRIGWQIDPFGHSNEMAAIFSELGFDGLFFARLDYRDKYKRIKTKSMELIWRGSESLGSTSDLFTGVFYDFYTQPRGYCWDVLCSDTPVIDDEESPDYNLVDIVNNFAQLVQTQIEAFQTNNLLVPMGGDFNYQAAEYYFSNLDKLIAGCRKLLPEINVIYSTPSCYLKAVNDAAKENGIVFPLKTDDFFPYASGKHSYWTGYFSSRPASKRSEREANNLLQVTKQLTTFDKITNQNDFTSDLTLLKEAMGIMQHHDAITGTEKQHVAWDYARIVNRAIQKSESNIDQIIIDLLGKDGQDANAVKVKMVTCLLANVTYCDASSKDKFTVAIYNPLSRTVTEYIRVPVNSTSFKIIGPEGEEVNYDVTESITLFDYIPDIQPSKYELVFAARMPPLGLKYYYVEKISTKENVYIKADDPLYFGTNRSGFRIDESGSLLSVTLNYTTLDVKQNFAYYTSISGNNSNENNRSSGAYIFRPKESTPNLISTPVKTFDYRGILFDEIRQEIGDFIQQIIRVYKDENYIEFDWVVGPIEPGTEVVSRYETSLQTNGIFYTDSNGREMMKRQRNYRETYNYTNEEPVSGNYYPVTTSIALRTNDLEFAVIADRAQGGSSLTDGCVELMVHRRCLHDDNFGVGEVLNETEFGMGLVVRGKHLLTFGELKEDTKHPGAFQRELSQQNVLSPWKFFGDASSPNYTLNNFQELLLFEFSWLTKELPPSVQILTLEPWDDDKILFRLENILEKRIDPKEVTISLDNLFSTFTVVTLQEMTLGANQLKVENNRLPWNSTETNYQDGANRKNDDFKEKLFEITLKPMEIRTFILTVQKM